MRRKHPEIVAVRLSEFDISEPSTVDASTISIAQPPLTLEKSSLTEKVSRNSKKRAKLLPHEPELSDSDEYSDFTSKSTEFPAAVGDETNSAVQSIQQVVVLTDPSAPPVSSSSVNLTNITVTPITAPAPAQFSNLQPVAVSHLTPSDRPLTLDSSILTVTFDTVSGSAMLHNRPPDLQSEAVGTVGATAPQSVAHFINLTTFVNPLPHQLEQPALTWRPVAADGAHTASIDDPQTDTAAPQEPSDQPQTLPERRHQIQTQVTGPAQQQTTAAPQMFSY